MYFTAATCRHFSYPGWMNFDAHTLKSHEHTIQGHTHTIPHKHTVFGHKHTIPEHRMLMTVREQLFQGAKGLERASCAYDAFPEMP